MWLSLLAPAAITSMASVREKVKLLMVEHLGMDLADVSTLINCKVLRPDIHKFLRRVDWSDVFTLEKS